MPVLHSYQNRLSYDLFKVVATSYKYAETKNIKTIDNRIFFYFLTTSLKDSLSESIQKEKVEKLIELMALALPSSGFSRVDFDSIKLSKPLVEIIQNAHVNPDKIGTPQVFHLLFNSETSTNDLKLKALAEQCGITEREVFLFIEKELKKKKDNEPKQAIQNSQPSQPAQTNQKQGQQKEDPIKKYCVDYNQKVIDGNFSPVFCRERELDQILVALMKKTKANPLLIGEPGVGKTALVESLAKRFVDNNVPERLKGYRVISVSMSSVVQGTTLRGQFEDRLEDILKTVIKDGKIIIFIDEMHSVIGSGGGDESGLDGSNIMKPYLARGEIKVIGATTFDDYYKRMRKDKAFSRRFQRVFVSEPNEKQTADILTGLSKSFESYHSCKIESGVLDHIVKLCRRFVNDRFFPDKAIDCLDHACAKSSLFSGVVTREIVEVVISEFADVPISVIRKGDIERLESVDKIIKSEIVGNDNAISEFCNRLKFSYSTKDSRKGVLCSAVLFGPQGIGKKSVVEKLANYLYGNNSLVVLNGAEYSESNSVNRIIGSPPGYVGHNEETYILREVRRHPNTVMLITNPDFMHNTVSECFKNIIMTGHLTDVNEMTADFSSCVIVFCVNTERNKSKSMGFVSDDHKEDVKSDFDVIKKRYSSIGSCNYNICFSDVGSDFKQEVIRLAVDKFVSDMKNSCIIIDYDSDCVNYLSSKINGSPSEITKSVRDVLESAMCCDFSSAKNEYEIQVVNNNIVVKAKINEICAVQS